MKAPGRVPDQANELAGRVLALIGTDPVGSNNLARSLHVAASRIQPALQQLHAEGRIVSIGDVRKKWRLSSASAPPTKEAHQRHHPEAHVE